jgi:hypothetical protein
MASQYSSIYNESMKIYTQCQLLGITNVLNASVNDLSESDKNSFKGSLSDWRLSILLIRALKGRIQLRDVKQVDAKSEIH